MINLMSGILVDMDIKLKLKISRIEYLESQELIKLKENISLV